MTPFRKRNEPKSRNELISLFNSPPTFAKILPALIFFNLTARNITYFINKYKLKSLKKKFFTVI